MTTTTEKKVYEGEFRVRDMLDRANDHQNPMRDVTLMGTTFSLPREAKFACIDSIQRYVDIVLGYPEIKEAWPQAQSSVKVYARNGHSCAHYQGGGIHIPMGDGGRSRWACRELVVLHELAHHLAYAEGDHGPLFRHAFVRLASVAMAPEVGFALQVCWHLEGVT